MRDEEVLEMKILGCARNKRRIKEETNVIILCS